MNYREELEKCASAPVEFQGMEKDAYAPFASLARGLSSKILNGAKSLWDKAGVLTKSDGFNTATALGNGALTVGQGASMYDDYKEKKKQKKLEREQQADGQY